MEIRKLALSDVPAVTELYATCMVDDHYFRNAYRLRRDTDRDALFDKLLHGHGPVLAKAIGLGTSFGAQDGSLLVGFCVCFWYKAIRQYDDALFRGIFADDSGNVDLRDGIHDRLATLRGTELYGLSMCVSRAWRRQGVATKLIGTAITRLRPDWFVADVSAPESMPIYERYGCEKHDLGDGRTFIAIKP